MSKNNIEIRFHYGQEDLKTIIKNIIKHKLALNTITSEINDEKIDKE